MQAMKRAASSGRSVLAACETCHAGLHADGATHHTQKVQPLQMRMWRMQNFILL
jgi:hypothetical protein